MTEYQMYCVVCKKYIGLYGWPSHVAKEKRIHGRDIYDILNGRKYPSTNQPQKALEEFRS